MSTSSGFCYRGCFANAESNPWPSPFSFVHNSSIVSVKLLPWSWRSLQVSSSSSPSDDNSHSSTSGSREYIKGSGTSARGRRLLRIREEKRQRQYDRVHNYPAWAKVLEDACKDDTELRAVLGDSIGNPELMRKRVS